MIHKKINCALHVLTYWVPWVDYNQPKILSLVPKGDFSWHLEYFTSSIFSFVARREFLQNFIWRRDCPVKVHKQGRNKKCKGAVGLIDACLSLWTWLKENDHGQSHLVYTTIFPFNICAAWTPWLRHFVCICTIFPLWECTSVMFHCNVVMFKLQCRLSLFS